MKQIVVVDDEKNFLLSLKDGLSEFRDQFSILFANNGQEALEILAEEEVHLVITDIKMPVMDGFELLAKMSNDYSDIPVIIMTAFGSSEIEDRLDSLGAFQYIEKPIDFDVLIEKVYDGLADADKGHLTGVSLSSFMQLLSLDKKTCTLRIRSGHNVGTIFFANGDLLQALTESLQGLEAALEIACWDPVEIEMQQLCRQREQVIDASLGYVLIESARMKDEKAELEANGGVEKSAPEDPTTLALEVDSEPLVFESEDPEVPPEIAVLLDVITPIKGVKSIVVAQKDGSIVAEINEGGALCSYYAGLVSQVAKMNSELRTSTPRTLVLNERFGAKVLIVNGPNVFVALGLGNEASADSVAGAISPLVQRLTL